MRRLIGVAVLLLLLPLGCDTTKLDVYREDDEYFVLFGYLDTSRAKQAIRVETLEDTPRVFGSVPDTAEVRVTLRDREAGEAVRLEETRLRRGDRIARYFTTSFPIRAGRTYRLAVRRLRDGATSQAEVTIPDHAPKVEVTPDAVIVHGIDRLGALLVFYSGGGLGQEVSLLKDAERQPNGSYRASLRTDDLPPREALMRVRVASVSEDWPEYDTPANSGSLPPTGIKEVSNVENGLGYVGGAITRTATP